jgi:hypothetical protein
MRFSSLRVTAVALAAALAIVFAAAPAPAQLTSYELPDIRIRFAGAPLEFVLPHVAACAENSLRFHEKLYGYTPSEPVTLFLEDFSDFGHGGANTVPTNFINFGIAPFNYVYDTVPAIDRMFWLANHEMAHIVTMDQAADRDLTFRRLFGGKVDPIAEHPESIFYNYLTNPRWNAPRWYHEGIAVFLETWMAGGLGRALGAYDEMVFRSMTLDDAHFYDVVGLESEGTTIDFQVGVNSYLYGTRFMSYLAYRYGPEKLIEWTGRQPGDAAYFGRQFRKVYAAPLDEEWARWIEFEKAWQRANLESIRRWPVTEFRQLSGVTLGSVSRAFVDERRNRLYVAVRYPGQLAHLAALDLATGSLTRLGDVKGSALFYVTSLAYDRDGDRIFYTTDNYGWRDLNVLDLATGQRRRLMRDARIGDLAYNRADRSLWGVRHYNGISTLVRMAEPYGDWNQIHSWPYGEDVYDLDISPDGRLLAASLAEVDGSQSLIAIDTAEILAGRAAPRTLFDFEVSSPSNFIFSADGRYLYGSSYYSGVSNVYRYDFAAADMDLVTNADTGFFRPAPVSDADLLVFRYTGQGLVPGLVPNQPLEHAGAIRFLGNAIAEDHPVVREWQIGSPARIDPETLKTGEGPYESFRHIRFNSGYPIVEGYKDSAAAGFHLDFSDALNLSGLDLSVSYSPDEELASDERLHARATLRHWNWRLEGTYNRADFYDLFGPTKTSRRGHSLGLHYDRTLRYDEPRAWRLKSYVVGWGDLETLPDAQNVAAGTEELVDGGVELEYEFFQRSLGAVEAEEGTRWTLFSGARYAESDTFPALHSEIERGWLLPLDHSSLWLRGSVGYAFGDRADPFSNFFFGGFGNNYVDHQEVKRFREFYGFPGVELNEIGGKNYAKLQAEWTLPPVRFRSVGAPAFYLNWAHVSIFSTALRTELERRDLERTFVDLGLQLDLKMVMFSNLSTTLSLGYAVANEEGGPSSDEFMVSLKIL